MGFRATISSVNKYSYPTNGKINALCVQTDYKISIENIYSNISSNDKVNTDIFVLHTCTYRRIEQAF